MKNKAQHDIGIGKRIKEARLKTDLSSIKVSQLLNLSDSVCSQWERGNANPSTAHLAKLSKILGVSFEWLALGCDKTMETKPQKQQIDQLLVNLNQEQKQHLAAFVKSMMQ